MTFLLGMNVWGASVSVQFAGDGGELLDDLRPAAAHGLERGVVRRRDEARMHEVKPRAAFDAGEGPRDDGVQWRAVPDIRLVTTLPGIGEALVRYHLQDLAVNDAVPGASRRGLEGEVRASHRRE